MRELEFIAKQVEVTALTIGERVARIHDALHGLRDLTLAFYEATERDESAIQGWIESSGFGIDEHGYYERLGVLARARAGEVDPLDQTFYANEAISEDPEARFRMYAFRGLPRGLCGLADRVPGMAWFYYQDRTGFALVYPMHDPSTVVPADFDWHGYITYQSVSPENNPRREIRWTPPNIDYGGKGLMVAPSIPLYRGDELFGVWSFDVPVRSLIEDSIVASVVDGQQSFIVDRDGVLIAHDSLETIVAPQEGDVYRKAVAQLGGGFATLDLSALWQTGRAELTGPDGESLYAVARPIPVLGWLLVATYPVRGVLQHVEQSFLEAFERAKAGDLSHRVASIGGDMQGIVDGFNDMTLAVQSTLEEKERTLRALESSRSHARALFDASPVGLALMDSRGRVVDSNTELARLLQRPSADAVDRSGRGDLEALLARAIESGASGPVETDLLRPDGSPVPVRLLARSLDREGESFVVVGVEDITERRHLQSQLLHTQKMQAIGRLAGGVAHDFNNLLTAIMANASLLSMKLEQPELSPLVECVELAAERAAALTAQLLAFSRREMVQSRRLDVAKVVVESERLLHRLLDDSVELSFQIDDALPVVRGDEGQLLQVVMNLVLNARDALHGEGRIDVVLGQRANPAQILLQVSDDGVGMDADVRSRLFEPFFTTKTHGTGLGLATVRDIVREMGGSIEVESEPGLGSRFTVVLPAAHDAPEARGRSARVDEVPIDGVVVVVDDEPLVREAAARSLAQQGADVEMVATAAEALQILERLGSRVALLVTDVVMPQIGGRELAEKAAKLCSGLPVLYMSGYTDDTILRHGIESDAVELVRKPFTPGAFTSAAHRAIARARDV